MLIYSENDYEVEIVDNALTNTFSVWFDSKPEDLVFHLLRAVGFRDRSFGREFYHKKNVKLRRFAEELQESLKQSCFPVEIPYQPRFEVSVKSITNFKFSITTLSYLNDEKKSCKREFVVFETNRAKRESFAWLIGYLDHGSALSKVETTEKIKRKEALQLFNEKLYQIKIPTPFGSGCLTNKREPPNEEILSSTNESVSSANVFHQPIYHGSNQGTNLSIKVGMNDRIVAMENIGQFSLSELFRQYANNNLKDGLNKVIEDKMREIVNPRENAFDYLKVFLPIDRINKENNRPKQVAPISEPYTEIFMQLYEVIPNMIQEFSRNNTITELYFIQKRRWDYYVIDLREIDKFGRYIVDYRWFKQYLDDEGERIESKHNFMRHIEICIDPFRQTAEAIILGDYDKDEKVYHYEKEQVYVDLNLKRQANLILLQELGRLKKEKDLLDLTKEDLVEHFTKDAIR